MTVACMPKILFVDDEIRLIESMTAALRRQYQVVTATSGAQALQLLRESPDISVIVSDMRMPGMDGAALLKQVAQHHPQIGRILLTGQSTLETAIRAVNEGGILKFLCKPCPLGALHEAIDAGLAHHRQHQQTSRVVERLARLEQEIGLRNRDRPTAPGDAIPTQQTETALLRALEAAPHNDELALHYQPLVDIASQRIISLEALLRWRHPQWGLMPPSQFIPLAERSGLIVPLGRWVLQHACAQINAWSKADIPVVPVAINVSALQLQQGLEGQISDALTATTVAPQLLSLEVTESTLMDDPQSNIALLQRLRDAGMRIQMDDFGTGYSSLSYLKQLPVDTLKIDRSFIAQIDTNATDAHIVRAILTLAHELNLKVVAEGVETAAQLAILRQYGCEVAQGYHFSRPLPAEQCRQLLLEAHQHSGLTEHLRIKLAK